MSLNDDNLFNDRESESGKNKPLLYTLMAANVLLVMAVIFIIALIATKSKSNKQSTESTTEVSVETLYEEKQETSAEASAEESVEEKYNNAIGLLVLGEYAKAAVEFRFIEDYKDSAQYADQIQAYSKALVDAEKGLYEKAADSLDECTLVPGSHELATSYKTFASVYKLSKEGLYDDAVAKLDSINNLPITEIDNFKKTCLCEYMLWLGAEGRKTEVGPILIALVQDKDWANNNWGIPEYYECSDDEEGGYGYWKMPARRFYRYMHIGENGRGTVYELLYDSDDEPDYYTLLIEARDRKGRRVKWWYDITLTGSLLDSNKYVDENDVIEVESKSESQSDVKTEAKQEAPAADTPKLEREAAKEKADALIAERKYEEAGPILLELVNDEKYLLDHFYLHVVHDDNFEDGGYYVGDEPFEYVKQYWDRAAVFALYFHDINGAPSYFHYRFTCNDKHLFCDYDMTGKLIDTTGDY